MIIIWGRNPWHNCHLVISPFHTFSPKFPPSNFYMKVLRQSSSFLHNLAVLLPESKMKFKHFFHFPNFCFQIRKLNESCFTIFFSGMCKFFCSFVKLLKFQSLWLLLVPQKKNYYNFYEKFANSIVQNYFINVGNKGFSSVRIF